MRFSVLVRPLALAAGYAEHLALERQLHDLAFVAPCFYEAAVGVEFYDKRLAFAVSLRDIDLPFGTERQIVGLVEAAHMAVRVPVGSASSGSQRHKYASFRIYLDDEMSAHVRG